MPRTVQPPRSLISLLTWCALFGILVGIHAANDLVTPVFVGLNLLIAAWPVRDALIKRGLPDWLGTIVLGLLTFTVLGLALFLLGWAVSALAKELPQYQHRFFELYHDLVGFLHSMGISEQQILTQAKTISPANIADAAAGVLSSFSGALAFLSVLVVVIFMLLMDGDTFTQRAKLLEQAKPDFAAGIIDFTHGVRRYWVVTTVFGIIVAIIDVAILAVLGVPLALVWGVVSFLTNYIPNVGFVIGVIPPALMALLAKDPMTALLVVILYSVINFTIQGVIQPKFNGDAVGVTALVSLISLLLWSTVLGPAGALFGLPATLLLKALVIDRNPDLRWFNTLIASDPHECKPIKPQADESEPAKA